MFLAWEHIASFNPWVQTFMKIPAGNRSQSHQTTQSLALSGACTTESTLGKKIYLNPATLSQFQRATAEPRAARRQAPLLYCLTRVKSSSLGKMRMADHLEQLSSRKIWMSYLDGLEDLNPFICTPAFPETSLQPGVGQREPRQLSTLQP